MKHFIFIILIILSSIVILNIPIPVYGAVPTIVSAQLTGGNTITITYSEPVISTIGDYSDLQLNLGGPRNIILVSGSLSDTIEITFDGAATTLNDSGTIDIAGTLISVSTLEAIIPLNDLIIIGQILQLSSSSDNTADKISSYFNSVFPSEISLKNMIIERGERDTKFNTDNKKNYVRVGEPFEFEIKFEDNTASSYLQKIEIYLNLREHKRLIHHSDTYVLFDKYKPLFVQDPNGFFSDVKLDVQTHGSNIIYKFEFVFAKPMEESNVLIQYIDWVSNSRQIEFPKFLHVVDESFIIPISRIVENKTAIDELSRYELVLLNNEMMGINYSDFRYEQDKVNPVIRDQKNSIDEKTVKQNSVVSGIKKSAFWWANGMIHDDQFLKSIKYLEKISFLELSDDEILIEDNPRIPKWMKQDNGWWLDTRVISDETFLDSIKYLIHNKILKLN